MIHSLLKTIVLRSIWHADRRKISSVGLISLLLASLLGLSLTYAPAAYATANHWSSLLQHVSNRPNAIISLQMQQIHSFNFMLDHKTWQLEDIQTFEDRERYEFSKKFKCISALCAPKTMLAMTFVTYKYGSKVFSQTQFKKHFPLSKWRTIFEKGKGITARFDQSISLPSLSRQLSHGFRYKSLKIGDTDMKGQIDLLYYGQSQVRFIISSPTTKQSILQKLLTTIEKTMTLQLLH